MTRRSRSIRKLSTNWPQREPGVPQSRALIVGIAGIKDAPKNASGDDALNICQDVALITQVLIDYCGYRKEDIITMTDLCGTPRDLRPTRQNLKRQLRSLVKGARRGDRHFWFYAGHGLQQKCEEDSDESDGMDECIKCADGRSLVDNWLKKHVVDKLPSGSSLFALFDACHSGTLLDLPHRRCNETFSIAMGLHTVTRLTRSVTSLPATFSSLSSPNASPSLHLQALPSTPSSSPLSLSDELAPPYTPSELFSSAPESLLFSPASSATSLFPTTPSSYSPSLPPQSTITVEAHSAGFPPPPSEELIELKIAVPSSPPTRSSKRKGTWYSFYDEKEDEKCDGLCSPVTHDVPLVVSLSSTADNEISFENQAGGPMTKAFVEAVRKTNGYLNYDNLMVQLRDRFADMNQERYIVVSEYRRQQCGDSEELDMYEQSQRPQLSSLYPLNMDHRVFF